MGIARKWVFPIIRLVVFAAIAAALINLAFFGTTEAERPLEPTGALIEPTVAVSVATISNEVTLDGTVGADDAVPVKASLAGEIRKVLIAPGQPVAPDTPIASIRAETASADPAAPPVVKTVTVTAGAAGTVSALPIIAGQVVAVGEAIAQVAPPSFHVEGALKPADQYRLLSRPAEAQVTITGGPAPFACTGLTITTPLPGAGSGGGSGAGGGDGSGDAGTGTGTGTGAGSGTEAGSGTTVRCAVPTGVTVFSGLSAKLTIPAGVAENALVVPVTAVEGSSGTGLVYQPSPDGGEPVALPVTLGLTDGVNVQITGGVAEGDEVLQFIPGAPVEPEPGVEVGYGG